jgi:hypothetical protein
MVRICMNQGSARSLVVEAAGSVGGTPFLSSGQLAAAGTKLQKSKGIDDPSQVQYDDIMRIRRVTILTQTAAPRSPAAATRWDAGACRCRSRRRRSTPSTCRRGTS